MAITIALVLIIHLSNSLCPVTLLPRCIQFNLKLIGIHRICVKLELPPWHERDASRLCFSHRLHEGRTLVVSDADASCRDVAAVDEQGCDRRIAPCLDALFAPPSRRLKRGRTFVSQAGAALHQRDIARTVSTACSIGPSAAAWPLR